MTKTKLILPTEMYIHHFLGTDFKIQPIPATTKELLEKALDEGAKVRLFPSDEEPTSLFISFGQSNPPVDYYTYEVLGVEMSLHLHLLGQYRNFDDKIKAFTKDIQEYKKDCNNLPKNYVAGDHKLVQVIKTYKY